MSTELSGMVVSYPAGEDLSSDQYRAVVLASDGTVRRPDSTAEMPIGVLQNAPASGEAAVVMLSGLSKVQLGATVAVGKMLKAEYNSASDAGKLIGVSTANDVVCGRAITGGDEDELVTASISCFAYTASVTTY